MAAKLRPGNVQSAEGWDELVLAKIERQQKLRKELHQMGNNRRRDSVDPAGAYSGDRFVVSRAGKVHDAPVRGFFGFCKSGREGKGTLCK